MAQKKQHFWNTIGPMLWSRFLLHRFGCDLRALDCQLALPISADEQIKGFVFGVRPYPDDSVTEMFWRTYALGKNPDGAYFSEPDGSGGKFNLFERVLARVPESRHWILSEANVYFSGQPTVDESAQHTSSFLSHGSMALLSAESAHAWGEQDLEGLVAAERLTLQSLSIQATPEALTLLLALLHLAIWHFVPPQRDAKPTNPDLPDVLAECCVRCATAIGQLDWVRGSEQGSDLAGRLEDAVRGAVHWVRHQGHRSPSTRQTLHRFPSRIVLIPDTAENQRRMRALSLRSSLYWFEPMLDPDDYMTLSQDWTAVKQALQAETLTVFPSLRAYPTGIPPIADKPGG